MFKTTPASELANAIHTGKAKQTKQTKTKHWLDQQILYLISPIAIY